MYSREVLHRQYRHKDKQRKDTLDRETERHIDRWTLITDRHIEKKTTRIEKYDRQIEMLTDGKIAKDGSTEGRN